MSGSLYTVEQAAERLKLHPKTVLRMIREGRLKAARIGKAYRISGDDLDAVAGVVRTERREASDRATVIVDFGDVGPDLANRLAGTLTGMTGSHRVRTAPITLETAYDPILRRFKVVAIGAPDDAATLLKGVTFLVENWR